MLAKAASAEAATASMRLLFILCLPFIVISMSEVFVHIQNSALKVLKSLCEEDESSHINLLRVQNGGVVESKHGGLAGNPPA